MSIQSLNPISQIEALLLDPSFTDLCINGETGVFGDRGNGMERLPIAPFSSETLHNWVLEQLSKTGKTWDARYPFLDATLPSGHRLHVAFPPLTRPALLVSLRRLASSFTQNHDAESIQVPLTPSRWANSPLYEILRNAVIEGDSILISGATGSGKTTLAGDLLQEVPSHERIIALEDTPELAPRHPHFLSLNSRPPSADGFGEVSLRSLLKQTLRMRPDRIILGECRGGEVLELLQALNTGHRGSLATLHANSPRDALRRIELLCLLAAQGSIPSSTIRELLSVGIQWVVQVHRTGPTRQISELWRIEGREGDTILMRPMVRDPNYYELQPSRLGT